MVSHCKPRAGGKLNLHFSFLFLIFETNSPVERYTVCLRRIALDFRGNSNTSFCIMNTILLPLRFAAAYQSWMLYAFALCVGCASAQVRAAEGFPAVGQEEEEVVVIAAPAAPHPASDCDSWREAMRNQPSVVIGGAVNRRTLSPAERSQLRRDVRGAYDDEFVTRSEAMGVRH